MSLCPQCGGPLPKTVLRGLCPRCTVHACLASAVAPEPGDPEPSVQGETTAEPGPPSAAPYRRFGGYELLEELGRGGMGVVYRARQLNAQREVALKMVAPQRLVSASDVERFKLEAETAARLEHPNILPLYDVGECQGQPYYTMKLVHAGSLAARVSEFALRPGRSPNADRADEKHRRDGTVQRRSGLAPRILRRGQQQWIVGLLLKIARAVAYAHQRGILHRDLKPANILFDETGEPYVADFGLAKWVERDTGLTQTMAFVGTPGYAAPEQVQPGPSGLTTAADVYGLGAILYELLTGRPPFKGATTLETLRQVMEDPVPPSRRWNPEIDRDLETLCLKCLEKDPQRRYATAAELADDLDRFQRGEPVVARPVPALGRLWRWSRRKPALAAMTGAAVAMLLMVTVVSAVSAVRIASAREAERRRTYYSNIELASRQIEAGSVDRALETLWECPEQYRHWEWGHLLYLCHQDAASFKAHETNVTATSFSPDSRWVVSQDAAGLAKVWNWKAEQQVFAFGSSSNRTGWVAFHPNGGQLAAAMGTNGVTVWATANWQPIFALRPPGGEVTTLAYGPHGRHLVTGAADGRVTVWDSATGQPLNNLETTNQPLRRVNVSSDGQRIVAVSQRTAWVWELHSGKLIRMYPDHRETPNMGLPTHPAPAYPADPYSGRRKEEDSTQPAASRGSTLLGNTNVFAFFADDTGEFFTTIDADGRLNLSRAGHAPVPLLNIRGSQPTLVRRAFFDPASRWMINAGEDNTARLWTLPTGTERLAIPERVHQVGFNADGSRMVTLGAEGWITTWDLTKTRKLKILRGHPTIVTAMALSSDGTLAVSGDESGTIKVWAAGPGREQAEDQSWQCGTSYSPDGRLIATCPDGLVIRSTRSGRVLLRVYTPNEYFLSSAFSPDSQRLVTAGGPKVARVWDVKTGELLLRLRGHRRMLFSVAYSHNGRMIATGSLDGSAKLWDAETGRELRTFFVNPADGYAMTGITNVPMVAFSMDDTRLIAASVMSGQITVWDLHTSKPVTTIQTEVTYAGGVLRVHPDGEHFITSMGNAAVAVWDLRSGRLQKQCQSRGFNRQGDISYPDGRRMVIDSTLSLGYGQDYGTIEIWDIEGSPREVLTLQNTEPFSCVGFSPDRRRIAGGGLDFRVHQWESFPWEVQSYADIQLHVDEPVPTDGMAARVRRYANRYWRERIEAERYGAEDEPAEPKVVTLTFDRTLLPSRDARATSKQLDLTASYTGELGEMFHAETTFVGQDYDDDLSALPTGLIELGGVTFDVRGAIQLRRTEPLGGAWEVAASADPVRVNNIPVHQKLHRLHLLVGTIRPESDGTVIGTLELRYTDGELRSVDLVYGQDVCQWWYDPAKPDLEPTSRGQVVWTGRNPAADRHGRSLRLYRTTRENPRPAEQKERCPQRVLCRGL